MASTGPILHVSFSAVCEIPNAAGRTTKYESVGMALDNAAGLVIAVGNREKRMTTFALHAVTRVHTKFLGSGKLTFEMTNPNQSLTQVLVSKCQPDDLKALLGTLDEAAKRAKQRGVASVSQDEAVGLLQTRFPEQVKKQLAKLREAKGSDAPMPIKSHTRLMLVVDAGGMSVVQAGKALCRLAEAELKLTSHPRPGESNAQSYKAVCKDGADKTVQLELRAKECVHHRLKKALWLDLELGDKMEVSKQGAEFGTRLELRRSDLDASSAPLGKCDLRFWEESNRMAAPVVNAFEMNDEACRGWSVANGNKPPHILATALVGRLEVFCLRLAASALGVGTRTRLLVCGWLPQVKTAAFVKRGFAFQSLPDQSLGFKMLKSDEARAREATAKHETSDAAAADSPAQPASAASASAPPSVDAAGSSSEAAPAGGPAGGPELAQALHELKEGLGGGATPGTGLGPSGKRRKVDDSLTPQLGGTDGPTGEGGDDDEANANAALGGARVAAEAIELGELSNLGRVGQSSAAAADGADEPAEEYVPVTSKYDDILAADAAAAAAAGGDAEEMDELDATMAELLEG